MSNLVFTCLLFWELGRRTFLLFRVKCIGEITPGKIRLKLVLDHNSNILKPFERIKFFRFENQLEKLNSLVLLLLTSQIQNTLKILRLGLNFESDLVQVEANKVIAFCNIFSSIRKFMRRFALEIFGLS